LVLIEEGRMPEIPETAELDRLIRALSKQSDDRLQRQLDDLRRESERRYSIVERRLAFPPLEPIRCPGLVSKRPARHGLIATSSENKPVTQGALAHVMSKLRNRW
jgi:hypothetical protein